MAAKILIVDQNPDYRDILESLLDKRGYMVTELEGGYQIANALKKKTFDIIFFDYGLSSVDMPKPLCNHTFYQEDGAFHQFRSSRVGLFSDVSAGDACPLRIAPLFRAGPAVSPTDTSGKDSTLPLVTFRKPHPLDEGDG